MSAGPAQPAASGLAAGADGTPAQVGTATGGEAAVSPLRSVLGRAKRAGTAFLPSPHRPGDDDTGTDQPGRVPRPLRAGALIGGLVLVAGAFAIGMHHDDPTPPRRTPVANPLGGDPDTGDAGAAPSGVPAPHVSPSPSAKPKSRSTGHAGAGAGAAAGSHSSSGKAHHGSSGTHASTRHAPAPVVATVSAGPGCGSAYRRVGYYTDDWSGWLVEGGACGTGTYDALPESGDANRADSSLYALWSFATGKVRRGRCTVSVYVPNNGDIRWVGGAPAHYTVAGAGTHGFTIDQPSHRGQWVNAGTYSVDDGSLTVRLDNTGQDWSGSTKTYRHVAAGDIRLRCTT
ncbi:MAG TPA: hypothetical protein VGN37_25265 [Actinocatenispora sp.]